MARGEGGEGRGEVARSGPRRVMSSVVVCRVAGAGCARLERRCRRSVSCPAPPASRRPARASSLCSRRVGAARAPRARGSAPEAAASVRTVAAACRAGHERRWQGARFGARPSWCRSRMSPTRSPALLVSAVAARAGASPAIAGVRLCGPGSVADVGAWERGDRSSVGVRRLVSGGRVPAFGCSVGTRGTARKPLASLGLGPSGRPAGARRPRRWRR